MNAIIREVFQAFKKLNCLKQNVSLVRTHHCLCCTSRRNNNKIMEWRSALIIFHFKGAHYNYFQSMEVRHSYRLPRESYKLPMGSYGLPMGSYRLTRDQNKLPTDSYKDSYGLPSSKTKGFSLQGQRCMKIYL